MLVCQRKTGLEDADLLKRMEKKRENADANKAYRLRQKAKKKHGAGMSESAGC